MPRNTTLILVIDNAKWLQHAATGIKLENAAFLLKAQIGWKLKIITYNNIIIILYSKVGK